MAIKHNDPGRHKPKGGRPGKAGRGANPWLRRQNRDPFVRAARQAGYRSRAAFKLQQIDDRFGLIRPGQRIVDLGAAPGGWSRICAGRMQGKGCLVALDLLEIDPIDGVIVLTGDLTAPAQAARLRAVLGGPADLVLSDTAPPATGHRLTDQLRSTALAAAAASLALDLLTAGGALVLKYFQGMDADALFESLDRHFTGLRRYKPKASRDESAELYLVATGFSGQAP